MEKSSYCCCYSRGCFNTGERNFHFSKPHSSPHAKQHTSLLRAKVKRGYPAVAKAWMLIVSNALNVESQRQVTVERLRYPDKTWSSIRYFWNLKCLSWIIWHRSSKRWRTTMKLEERREDLWLSQSSVSDTVWRRKNSVMALHVGSSWFRLNPASLPPHARLTFLCWKTVMIGGSTSNLTITDILWP